MKKKTRIMTKDTGMTNFEKKAKVKDLPPGIKSAACVKGGELRGSNVVRGSGG